MINTWQYTVVPSLLQSWWRQYSLSLQKATEHLQTNCVFYFCASGKPKQSFMVQELESCCLFLVETRKQTLACASEWLVRRGHLSLEDKPYCKSDYKDVELDLSLNSSAE